MTTEKSDEILHGGAEIAEFLLGSRSRHRSINRAIQAGRLPGYVVGGTYCARRSVLKAWRDAQENRALA